MQHATKKWTLNLQENSQIKSWGEGGGSWFGKGGGGGGSSVLFSPSVSVGNH